TGRGGLNPAQIERPSYRFRARSLVPTCMRACQENIDAIGNFPRRHACRVIDDPGTRPMLHERRTYFRSQLIDHQRRANAGNAILNAHIGLADERPRAENDHSMLWEHRKIVLPKITDSMQGAGTGPWRPRTKSSPLSQPLTGECRKFS